MQQNDKSLLPRTRHKNVLPKKMLIAIKYFKGVGYKRGAQLPIEGHSWTNHYWGNSVEAKKLQKVCK
jgi:hypothetical protein